MKVTRSKVIKTEENWNAGSTYREQPHLYPGAPINIDYWAKRIVCYGDNEADAETLRDHILKAVEAYNGK